MKKVTQIIGGYVAEGSSLGVEIPWLGGDGLLMVSGTFAGAAVVSVSGTAYSDAAIGSAYDLGLAPISAPGTYGFAGAPGKLYLSIQTSFPGDSINGLALTLAELS